MPKYISKDGVWYPQNERVGLINRGPAKEVDGKRVESGDPYVYEGPDRASLFALYQEGVENFGIDFHHDPDMIYRAKALGYKDVDEYAAVHGYNKEKIDAEFAKNSKLIKKEEIKERVESIKVLGGGKDFSGQGNDKFGGFGDSKV